MSEYRFYSREKGWSGSDILIMRHYQTNIIRNNLIEKYSLEKFKWRTN